MQFSVRESGLAVPTEKTKPPERRYGPMEVQGDEDREATRVALLSLWDALDLSASSAFILPGAEAREAQRDLWRFAGEMLLGRDCPEREVMT